jgi:hypothetical protein
MDNVLNTLGNVLGTVVDVTGKGALALFCGVLLLMAVAVPLYTVYAVVGGMRSSRTGQQP